MAAARFTARSWIYPLGDFASLAAFRILLRMTPWDYAIYYNAVVLLFCCCCARYSAGRNTRRAFSRGTADLSGVRRARVVTREK